MSSDLMSAMGAAATGLRAQTVRIRISAETSPSDRSPHLSLKSSHFIAFPFFQSFAFFQYHT